MTLLRGSLIDIRKNCSYISPSSVGSIYDGLNQGGGSNEDRLAKLYVWRILNMLDLGRCNLDQLHCSPLVAARRTDQLVNLDGFFV